MHSSEHKPRRYLKLFEQDHNPIFGNNGSHYFDQRLTTDHAIAKYKRRMSAWANTYQQSQTLLPDNELAQAIIKPTACYCQVWLDYSPVPLTDLISLDNPLFPLTNNHEPL